MKAECDKCGKPTWKGCGKHIEQALKDVPEDERCKCPRDPPTPAANVDKTEETKQDIKTEETKQDVKTGETKQDVKAEETKQDVKTEETKSTTDTTAAKDEETKTKSD